MYGIFVLRLADSQKSDRTTAVFIKADKVDFDLVLGLEAAVILRSPNQDLLSGGIKYSQIGLKSPSVRTAKLAHSYFEPLPPIESEGFRLQSEIAVKDRLTSPKPRVELPTLLIFKLAFASLELTF